MKRGGQGPRGLGQTLHKWKSQWLWSPTWLEEQRQLAGGGRLGRGDTAERRGAGEHFLQVPGNCPFASGGFCPPEEC